jgi:cobalt/nickel transport system permease protein
MKKSRFVDHSIEGAISFAARSLEAEEYASRRGFLQSFDPRARVSSLLALLALVIFAKSLAVLGILYGLCLLLAVASKIDFGFFLKRTLVFIPIFSLFMALPAAFSFATPGEAVLRLGPAVVTRQGLWGGLFFVCRVTTAVSYSVLLSLSTRHFALLKVLRAFGVPPVFVMVFGMAYRYLCLFVEMVENTFKAVKSRVGFVSATRQGQRLVAWNIANLWARSFQMNEQVYLAMRSRGYRGEPVLSQGLRAQARDWAWVMSVLLFALALAWAQGKGLL